VRHVEKHHEHTVPWVCRHPFRVSDRVWLDPGLGRRPGVDHDVFEGLNALPHAVFEQFEIIRGQTKHGFAVPRGKCVHSNEVRLAPEDRGLLRVWRRFLRVLTRRLLTVGGHD